MFRVLPCLFIAGCCCCWPGGGGSSNSSGGGFFSDYVGERIAEKVTERALGVENVDVRRDGSVVVTGGDGVPSFQAGTNTPLPEGFPITPHSGSEVRMNLTSGDTYSVTLQGSSIDVEALRVYYTDALSSLGTVSNNMDMNDGSGERMIMLAATDANGKAFTATIVSSPGDEVMVMLSGTR